MENADADRGEKAYNVLSNATSQEDVPFCISTSHFSNISFRISVFKYQISYSQNLVANSEFL